MIGDVRISFAVGRDRLVHVDGSADAALHAGGVQSFAGGTLAQLSDNVYQLSWSTGRSVTITDHGDYLDWVVGLGVAGRPRLGARACSAATAAGQRISSCRTALS